MTWTVSGLQVHAAERKMMMMMNDDDSQRLLNPAKNGLAMCRHVCLS